MITLELTDRECIRILAVMECRLDDNIDKYNRLNIPCLLEAIRREGCIVKRLREALDLTEYAAEIDKLEVMESENDAERMDSESDEAAR